jgi:hypothetical protein
MRLTKELCHTLPRGTLLYCDDPSHNPIFYKRKFFYFRGLYDEDTINISISPDSKPSWGFYYNRFKLAQPIKLITRTQLCY